ncbi:hypothetical protein ACHAW5_000526 [Stephanodiscus triporus]|uniref:RNA polymerase sigma-70 region 2 domain-containing protein n=1 Tax=Stephanodiscus triporus TaxID=2934178 RepID=A0ABD3MMH3_9STRA
MPLWHASAGCDDDARQALLLHNLPLVKSIVTEVRRSRALSYNPSIVPSRGGGGSSSSSCISENGALTSDDLLHEGTIGLAEAIDRHDPRHETRLSTYATYWIRARVIRALQSRGEHALLRFPERALQASHRLVRAAREMGLDWDDVVDMSTVDDEYVGDRTRELRSRLCERAGISLSSGGRRLFDDAVRVRSMSRSGTTTAPLESWMGSSSYASAVADGGGDDDDDIIIGVGLSNGSIGGGQEHIVETLSRFLMPREVEVLSLRYGLVPSSSGGEEDEDEGRTESK